MINFQRKVRKIFRAIFSIFSHTFWRRWPWAKLIILIPPFLANAVHYALKFHTFISILIYFNKQQKLVFPFVWGASFRALFSISPYHPSKKLNAQTGVLVADTSYKVLTMCSRICAIWGNVFDSRSRFEAIPDKVCVVFLITLNLATFKIYSNRRRQLPFYV